MFDREFAALRRLRAELDATDEAACSLGQTLACLGLNRSPDDNSEVDTPIDLAVCARLDVRQVGPRVPVTPDRTYERKDF